MKSQHYLSHTCCHFSYTSHRAWLMRWFQPMIPDWLLSCTTLASLLNVIAARDASISNTLKTNAA